MSVSLWAYSPEKCDGQPCCGDCDRCEKKEDKNGTQGLVHEDNGLSADERQ